MNIPLVLNGRRWMDALGVRERANDMVKLEIFGILPSLIAEAAPHKINEAVFHEMGGIAMLTLAPDLGTLQNEIKIPIPNFRCASFLLDPLGSFLRLGQRSDHG